jgi:uncharacterized YigZ family protein
MTDTLASPVRFELEVKKSRFLVNAATANSPQAALDWLDAVALREATHNCWAYRIGQQYRFSDDGEPSGTAGRPILAAIDGQGFDRVVAVVTRWYGGVKLGAGGLVRAYGGATAECLRRAPRHPIVEQVDATLHCQFSHSGAVHALLASIEAIRLEERFEADGLHLTLRLPQSAFAGFQRAVSDATRGQATMAVIPSHDT